MRYFKTLAWAGRATGLLLLFGTVVSNSYAETAVTLHANESPPFFSRSMQLNGMAGEIIHAVSKAAGLKSVIEFKPLKRMIDDDANNDLGNPAFFMGNQNFVSIIPIAIYHIAIFHYLPNHPSHAEIHSLKDLTGHKIGILKGTLVDRAKFEKAGITFEESYSQASLFKKLQKGRIDLVIETDLVGKSMINRLFPFEVEKFSSVLIPKSESPIAILLAEKQANGKALGGLYRHGLQKIMLSGEYEAILNKHYGYGIMPENYMRDLERFNMIYIEGDE